MKYRTGAAFRAALESHLSQMVAIERRVSLARSRKLVVFDRLLARLLGSAPNRWMVKGGVALDLRLGDRARATKDLDLAYLDVREHLVADLIASQSYELDDFFTFFIEARTGPERLRSQRYHARAELAGRVFEEIILDVGIERTTADPETGYGRPLLGFAGINAIAIPLLPLEQHTAEKVHAYTRLYEAGRPSSRVKDLVDLVLIRSIATFESSRVRRALDQTFHQRGTHPLPRTLPAPPSNWTVAYRTAAREISLTPETLLEGYAAASGFLDPVLGDLVASESRWDHVTGRWR